MPRRRRYPQSSPTVRAATAVVEAIESRRLLAVTVNATDATAMEPDNNGTLLLTRDTSTAAPLTVSFTLGGTATRGADYQIRNNGTTVAGTTVTIPAGQATLALEVDVVDNDAIETDQTVVFNLVATADYTLGTSASSTVIIRDDDGLPSTINPSNPLGLNTGNSASGDFGTYEGSYSADSRYAVFVSRATNVVGEPPTTFFQVYRRDLVNGTSELVTISADGKSEANNNAVTALISGDGRYIAFETLARNIVSGNVDKNSVSDVYVKDMQTGAVTLVTRNRSGAVGGSLAAFSFDGRLVAFQTSTSGSKFIGSLNDTNSSDDLFIWSRNTGKYEAVSVDPSGNRTGNRGTVANVAVDTFAYPSNAELEVEQAQDGLNDSGGTGVGKAQFSADGRYILFPSKASNLVSGITDGNTFQTDFFRRDLVEDETVYVTMSRDDDASANDDSGDAEMTADGRYVVFRSNATDLVDGDDNNEAADIFLRDIEEGTTTLISKRVIPNGEDDEVTDELGITAQGASITPDITADGRFIVFSSEADDLTQAGLDDNGRRDVFRYEVANGRIRLVSIDAEGEGSAQGESQDPSISEDGRLVLFTSDAADLPGDRDKLINSGFSTVYMRNMDTLRNRVVSFEFNNAFSQTASAADAFFSPDGTRIMYASWGDNFGTGLDGNGEVDLFDVETPGNEAVRVELDPTRIDDDDAANDDNGTLIIMGSPINDTISVQKVGASRITIRRNGVTTTLRYSNIDAIKIYGYAGDDTISIATSVRGSSVDGGQGNDTLRGGSGDDSLYGGTGRDLLIGNAGDDRMSGGKGNDTLRGGIGNDRLFGQEGSDLLLGEANSDRLDGGPSRDTLNGAGGTDTVVNGDAEDILISTEA